jgi:hypothetical protein
MEAVTKFFGTWPGHTKVGKDSFPFFGEVAREGLIKNENIFLNFGSEWIPNS